MLHAACRHEPGAAQRGSQQAIYERLVQQATRRLAVPVMIVTLVERSCQRLLASSGLTQRWTALREITLEHSLCQYVVASVRPFYVSNAPAHWLIYDHPAVVDLGVMAYAGIPLTTTQGQVLGALEVFDATPRTWSEPELAILQAIAADIVAELEQSNMPIDDTANQNNDEPEAGSPPPPSQLRSLHGIAHDLGNALTSILGNAEFALLKLPPDASGRPAIEAIQRAARQARAAWDDMQRVLEREQPLQPDAAVRSDQTIHAFVDISRDLDDDDPVVES